MHIRPNSDIPRNLLDPGRRLTDPRVLHISQISSHDRRSKELRLRVGTKMMGGLGLHEEREGKQAEAREQL